VIETGMKTFWRGMLALGAILMILRAANIAYVQHCAQRDGIEYDSTPDTGSYILNSEAMFDGRPMSPLFRERIAYPFLLAVVRGLGLDYRWLPYLTAPLEIPAVLAMALLGWVLTRRRAVAALAAILYALNPNGFQASVLIMPDWLNGQIMLMAIALIMHWALDGHRPSGWAAALLLPVSQMFRPTLFLVAAPLVCLLAKGFFLRERRVLNALLLAAAVAYPAFNLLLNQAVYGVPNLLLSSGFQIHACYVPYVRALERNAEQPESITRLYFDEKHNVSLADPREQLLNPFGATPVHPDFAATYAEVVASSKEYLNQRRGLWFQAGLRGLLSQLLQPPRFSPSPGAAELERFERFMQGEDPADVELRQTWAYPEAPSAMRKMHYAALFFTLCGVLLSIRRLPVGVTLFYAGCTAMIAMASTAAWYDSVRVRLLVDLIYTPILAIGLLSLPAWLGFMALGTVGYGPRRLFGWPHAYVQVTATLITLLTGFVMLRRADPRQDLPARPPPG
jgi:hypothetical protein